MPDFRLTGGVRTAYSGSSSIDATVTTETGEPVATAFTLAGGLAGITGVPYTFTVTPNGALSVTTIVFLIATDAALSVSTLTFSAGSSAAQTFTATRVTDGSTSVSMSNSAGLAEIGDPQILTTAAAGSLLTTIGPATPEQISLFLPVDDSVPYTATATCRYKRSVDSLWTIGHPLHRIRNDVQPVGEFGNALLNGFAWPIIDLYPGTSYDVEVTMTNGAAVTTHTLTTTTRALPSAAAVTGSGQAKTATSYSDLVTKLAGLNPGDVLTIAAGDYTVTADYLYVDRSGTAANPIYIRGASRTGTILRRTRAGSLFLCRAKHIVFENMTLIGYGVNNIGGSSTSSTGIHFGSLNYNAEYMTLRNLIVSGVDRGFWSDGKGRGMLIYNNTVTGNNPWEPNQQGPGTSDNWGDDGIHLPGEANCAFQNTISGFGDTFAYCSGYAQGQQVANAVHFYRNEIRNSCDDSAEADDAEACCTFYDNRITNGVNMMSLDGLYGGPFVLARNIYLNLFRTRPFKWNSTNTGHFTYNNTVYTTGHGSTDPADDTAKAYQPSNGRQSSFGWRNNVYISLATAPTRLIKHDSGGYQPVDWTHNSWYPDGRIDFSSLTGGDSLALTQAAEAGAARRVPVFSGVDVFMYQDNITTSSPWVTPIPLGATSGTELLGEHLPVPAHASLKYTGVAIPNITDNFSGAAPDRGAVIEGRALVAYGDQTDAIPSWVPTTPLQWVDIPGTNFNDGYGFGWPSQSPDPFSGEYGKIWDYGGTTYSEKHHEYWLFGGGHAGTTINSLHKLNLNTNTPIWEMVNPGTDKDQRNLEYYGDITAYRANAYHFTSGLTTQRAPKSPHAYTNNVFFDATDTFAAVVLHGVNDRLQSSITYSVVASHPRLGGVWEDHATWPVIDGLGQYQGIGKMQFKSLDGRAIYYANTSTGLYKLTDTKVRTTIRASDTFAYQGVRGCAVSDTKALILAASWTLYYLDLTTGVRTALTTTGAAFQPGYGCRGLVLLPNGDIVGLFGSVNGTPHLLVRITVTGATSVNREILTTTGTAPLDDISVVCGVAYDPTFDVVLMANRRNGFAKAIKVV